MSAALPQNLPPDPPKQPLRVRVHNPQQLAATVPHLLGFHPENSLVAIMLRHGLVVVTVRIDMPDQTDSDLVWDAWAMPIIRSKADKLVLIAYAGPEADAVLASCASTSPIPVLDTLRIHDGRLWVLTCPVGPSCCPPGSPLPAQNSEVAATFSRSGRVVAASRSDLSDCLHPASDSVLKRVTAHLETFTRQHFQPTAFDQYTLLDIARRDRLDGPVALNELEAARLLSGLADPEVRDACCCWGDPGWWLWLDLIPFTPVSHVPAVATLIAIHAFQRGEGPMALIAAEHALAADSGHVLAQLVLLLAQRGWPPEDMVAKFKEMSDLALARVRSTSTQKQVSSEAGQ